MTTTISIIAAAITLRTLQTTASVIGTVPTCSEIDGQMLCWPSQARMFPHRHNVRCAPDSVTASGLMAGCRVLTPSMQESMGRHQCRVWPPGFEYTVDNVQEFRANAGGPRLSAFLSN